MVKRNIKIVEEEVVGDIKFEGTLIFAHENVVVKGNIGAGDIDAGGIEARDIEAGNIRAGDIGARNIDALNIDARDIRARNIRAWNIRAGDIDAGDIEAWSIEAGNIWAGNINVLNGINVAGEIRAFSVKGRIRHGKFVKRRGEGARGRGRTLAAERSRPG